MRTAASRKKSKAAGWWFGDVAGPAQTEALERTGYLEGKGSHGGGKCVAPVFGFVAALDPSPGVAAIGGRLTLAARRGCFGGSGTPWPYWIILGGKKKIT